MKSKKVLKQVHERWIIAKRLREKRKKETDKLNKLMNEKFNSYLVGGDKK